jgi:dolichol-phosphate mannosyltransferase
MIWVLVPVYNEASGIKNFIETTFAFLQNIAEYRLVLVDDGSSDQTAAIARDAIRENDAVLRLDKNTGPGKAFETGMHYFLKQASQDDLLLTLEGDGTADLSSLPEMIKQIENADLILASVYLEGGGFSKTSALRLMISHAANTLSRLWLGMPYRTLTSFYRLWRYPALNKLNKEFSPLIEATGFICQVELLYKSHLLKQRILEVPTRVYSERRKGASKMKLLKTALSHVSFLLKSRKYKTEIMK